MTILTDAFEWVIVSSIRTNWLDEESISGEAVVEQVYNHTTNVWKVSRSLKYDYFFLSTNMYTYNTVYVDTNIWSLYIAGAVHAE